MPTSFSPSWTPTAHTWDAGCPGWILYGLSKDEREWIKGLLDAGAEGWVYPLMIMYKGLLVGSIGILTLGSTDRASEIGYWLAENVQGRGIATRACRTLLDYAFGSRGMNRLQIRAAVDNTRSRAIPERLRFTFEGVQRQAKLLNDDFQDLAVYSMLAAEWQLKRVGSCILVTFTRKMVR